MTTTQHKDPQKDKQQQIQQQLIKAQSNSRQLDNHYDPRIHEKPWIAPGITPDYCYIHTDSGLAFDLKKGFKLQQFKERYEIEEEIKSKFDIKDNNFSTLRQFKEFENIKDNDIIITIEYCTNCKNHLSSTRHDEVKYYQTALKIKQEIIQSFPVVKVYLKPLIYDQSDHSINTLFLQRRLGALEVQIASRINGVKKFDKIYSKLDTKRWPTGKEILEKIPNYLNKCNLVIELILDSEEMDNMPEVEKENTLKGISVLLKPLRQKNNQSSTDIEKSMNKTTSEIAFGYGRPLSNINRPISGMNRPKSGFSTASIKTIQSLNKKIDQNQKPFNHYNAVTDKDGKVVFNNIPHDVYTVEIQETNDFLSEKRTINIFELIENEQPLIMNICLRKQKLAFLFLQLIDGYIYVNEAQIEILIADIEANQKPSLVKEIPPNSGKYEIIVDPGNYRLIINKDGYETLEKIIQAKSGTNTIKIPMKQKAYEIPENEYDNNQSPQKYQKMQDQMRSKSSKNLICYIYNATDNSPIQNAIIKLEESSTNKVITYTTDESGCCAISLQNLFEGKLIIENKNYFKIEEFYGPSKMNLHSMKDISFPLIKKPTSPNELHIMISTAFREKYLSLNVITPDNQVLSKSSQDIEIENKFDEGYGFIKILNINQKNGIFRIYANLGYPDIFNHQYIKLYIINDRELNLVEIPKAVPKTSEKPKFWDIGIIVAPKDQFVEINATTSQEITRDLYLKEYQDLLNFINNSKGIDLKTILGFNTKKDKLEVNNDIFVPKEKIIQSLDKYGYEQKNIDHLIASALHSNGLYSYRKLEKKLKIRSSLQFVTESDKEQDGDHYSEDEEYLD